jgi:ribonuclease D
VTPPARQDPGLADADELGEVSDAARRTGRIALDTEFMGEGRYRTLLCLVQVAVPDTGSSRTALLDPLSDSFDGAPLAAVLGDPAIEVVVHAGRQDIALIRRCLGTEVRNVFDTQVAAGFAGLPAQASYDSLLSEVLRLRVAKSASYTRWDARPLSAEQAAYAREDVEHLLDLAAELQRRLQAQGRLGWARQECEILEQSSDERDLDAIYARLPRIRGLRTESQAVARELVEWRERTAASQNRPVQSVLGDAALVEVAKRRPSSMRDLEQIRGVNQGSLRRRGDELLAAVARGRSRAPVALAEDRRPPPPDTDDAPLIALTESLVRGRAREAGLAYELVAARADLQAIVTGWRHDYEPAVRTLQGWRRELVGAELIDLLAGQVSLSVDDGRLRVTR